MAAEEGSGSPRTVEGADPAEICADPGPALRGRGSEVHTDGDQRRRPGEGQPRF